jgi:hypothetical protein
MTMTGSLAILCRRNRCCNCPRPMGQPHLADGQGSQARWVFVQRAGGG